MRKIEQEMLNAIKSLRVHYINHFVKCLEWSKDNTRVTVRRREDHQIVTSVFLHGNLIAQFSGDSWGFKMCGWDTPTTRSRINAIAQEFNHPGITCKNGKRFCGDKEINSHDWF